MERWVHNTVLCFYYPRHVLAAASAHPADGPRSHPSTTLPCIHAIDSFTCECKQIYNLSSRVGNEIIEAVKPEQSTLRLIYASESHTFARICWASTGKTKRSSRGERKRETEKVSVRAQTTQGLSSCRTAITSLPRNLILIVFFAWAFKRAHGIEGFCDRHTNTNSTAGPIDCR